MLKYNGRSKRTINFLKTIYFDHPEWIHCDVSLMAATWMKYREELEKLVLAHPRIFPNYKKGSRSFDAAGGILAETGRHKDNWGVVFANIERGLSSIPISYPIEDWSALDSYIPPDPMTEDNFSERGDWENIRQRFDDAKKNGNLATGGLAHGFMYMRLYYLRGFENFMLDLASDDPHLPKLIKIVEDYNLKLVEKYLSVGAEYISAGDDLGLQTSLPMSPEMWRKYIRPSYERIFATCRESDTPIRLHTDGHVLPIIPDLIEVGIKLLNPQIRANGLEGLQEMAKGKVAIHQDLDRQLFPFATPSEIEDHIGEVFEGLYMKEGGLMLHAECEPDVPLENIEAICRTLEKLCNPPEI